MWWTLNTHRIRERQLARAIPSVNDLPVAVTNHVTVIGSTRGPWNKHETKSLNSWCILVIITYNNNCGPIGKHCHIYVCKQLVCGETITVNICNMIKSKLHTPFIPHINKFCTGKLNVNVIYTIERNVNYVYQCILIYLRSIAKQVIPTSDRAFHMESISSFERVLKKRDMSNLSLLLCVALSKESSGTIFIMHLVWRGRWSSPRPPLTERLLFHRVID